MTDYDQQLTDKALLMGSINTIDGKRTFLLESGSTIGGYGPTAPADMILAAFQGVLVAVTEELARGYQRQTGELARIRRELAQTRLQLEDARRMGGQIMDGLAREIGRQQ